MLGTLLLIFGYVILFIMILIVAYLFHILMTISKADTEIHYYERQVAKHVGIDLSEEDMMDKYNDFFNKSKEYKR